MLVDRITMAELGDIVQTLEHSDIVICTSSAQDHRKTISMTKQESKKSLVRQSQIASRMSHGTKSLLTP